MKKEVKIMVGCRVEPDLKSALEAEATQNTKTVSAYIDGILRQRHSGGDDVEKLKERIFELEMQNAALQSRFQSVTENENGADNTVAMEEKVLAQDVEIRTLKQQKMEVMDMYKRVVDERNVLSNLQGKVIPHWISNDNYNRMINNMKQLKKLHPQYSHEQLLIVSLATVIKNENSVITMNRITDFLKSHPNFFTTQKGQNQ